MMQRRNDKTPFLRHGKVLKPIDNGKGYKAVTIVKDTDNRRRRHYIHRLVLETFTDGHEECQTDVNHKDGNKGNNCLDNLEWCTRTENNFHAYNTGLHVCGERHPQAKYSAEIIETIKMERTSGKKVIEISRKYGIPHQYVSGILNGKKRRHG